MQPHWQGNSSDQRAGITLARDHPSSPLCQGVKLACNYWALGVSKTTDGVWNKHYISTKSHSCGKVQDFAL